MQKDPDAVLQRDGSYLFKTATGGLETWAQREKRLAHNAKMRFNRSLESVLTALDEQCGLMVLMFIVYWQSAFGLGEYAKPLAFSGRDCPQVVLDAARDKKYSPLAGNPGKLGQTVSFLRMAHTCRAVFGF